MGSEPPSGWEELSSERQSALLDLADARIDGSMSRRQALKAGGVGALGLLGLTGGASASTDAGTTANTSTPFNDGDGSIGTDSNRIDAYLDAADANSVSTEQSLTDPAGVEHTGELADASDVGGGLTTEDDGTQVLADTAAVNFASNLSVADDGDGTVTVDADGGDGSFVWETLDDTATPTDIQNTLDSIDNAGGGVLVLAAGTYSLPNTGDQLVVGSNTTIVGAGQDATVIRREWDSDDRPVIRNSGFDASGYNGAQNITIKDLTVDVNRPNVTEAHSGIAFAHAERVKVRNCEVERFKDNFGHAIELCGVRDATISECYLHDGEDYALEFESATGTENVSSIDTINADGTNTQHVSVVNNRITDNYGIEVEQDCEHVTIEDNDIINTTRPPSNSEYTVMFQSNSDREPTDISVRNNYVDTIAAHGIEVAFGPQEVEVSGNRVIVDADSGTGYGINVYGDQSDSSTDRPTRDVIVSGNIVTSNEIGIGINQNSDGDVLAVLVSGNNVTDCTTGVDNGVGSDATLANNIE